MVEVRQGAGGAETRRGDEERRGEEEEEEEQATDIKSNNPHLAGGEKAHKEKHREIRFWGYVPGLVPALRAKSRNLRLKMTMLHT